MHRQERAELSLLLAGLAAEAEPGERRRALEPDRAGLAAALAAIRWSEAVMANTKDAAAAAGAAECADSARLCDYKDCRKLLHKLLLCSKCKRTAYCCKECQVRPVGP